MTEDNEPKVVSNVSLADFIFSLSTVLLSATKQDIVFFKQNDLTPTYESFIHDPTQASLFISKQEGEEKVGPQFAISSVLDSKVTTMSAMVVIKEKGVLVNSLPLDSQLQVINLPLNSNQDKKASFETIRSLVSFGIAPYFDTLSKLNNLDNIDGDSGSISLTRKKINELVLSLQHLQQTVQIPDLIAGVHPKIKEVVANHTNEVNIDELADLIDQDLLSDSIFLNNLQNTVNKWIKAVQDITQSAHDPKDGSAKDEVNFWLSMEIALINIQGQLNSPEVQLTLTVLKKAKRFHATISFLSDTGIKEALTIAQKYNQLMKDLPLDEILSATSFNKLSEAIILVFNHLKKLRVTQYPISRAISFVEAISSDVEIRMKAILGPLNLMSLSDDEFHEIVDEVRSCFDTFDLNVKEFTSLARELLRKRNEKFILVKVSSRTINLQERIDYIINFREKHNELINTISKISIQNNLLSDLEYAYSSVENVDVTDLSIEGRKIWDITEKLYNERTSKIHHTVILMLRKLLSSAKDSNEMFEIFENFKFLLVQDSIRNAIQEYQSQLLNVVKADIKSLQSQFLKQSEITKLFKLRDIPPVSATIIWAKQIEQRLEFLTDRCELILGSNWRQYPEGQKVHAELIVFRTKLNTDGIFEAWLKDSLKHTNKSVENLSIFKIVKNSASSNYEVIVTFDHSVMNLFKEVRHLCWLEYDVPHSIVSNSRTIRKIYPHAIGITESLLVWNAALEDMEKLGELSSLLQFDMGEIISLISSLLPFKWETLAKLHELSKLTEVDNDHLEELEEIRVLNQISLLEESILKFSNKIVFLQNVRVQFNTYLSQLNDCPYQFSSFEELLSAIQNIINDIIFEDFSGTEALVSRLNYKINSILSARCSDKLTKLRLSLANEEIENDNSNKQPALTKMRSEIIVRDQSILVSPPIETVKMTWYNDIRQCINVISNQKMINANTIDVNVLDDSVNNKSLYFQTESIAVITNECIDTLESRFTEVFNYVKSWLDFQALWDLEIEEVYESLSNKLSLWIQFLLEFKNSRQTFDTVETFKDFGNLIIDYEHAQTKINARYDTWQRQIFGKFAYILGGEMKEYDHNISTLKVSLEITDLNDYLNLISTIDEVQSQAPKLEKELKDFRIAENLLIKNRFRFPADWLHIDQLNDDYDALTQILSKRQKYIESEMQIISQKIENESVRLEEAIDQVRLKWSTEKPVTGDLVPAYALSVLQDFETTMTEHEHQKSKLISSANILNMHIRSIFSLSSSLEEISDLKSVWTSIDTLWISLQDYRHKAWKKISPRELRHQLDDLLSRSRAMPARVRQYSAFEDVQVLIKNYNKSNKLISDLLSESMKEHHWKKIFSQLGKLPIALEQLTLGDVWDLDLLLNEQSLKVVISQAIGEKSIEDEITKIEESWQDIVFEFFNYQGKIRFVKKWDVLFEQCTDNLNSLISMQHSTHYKIFEQRGSSLIEKLNKLFRLLDTWIEVQKQYVYVDGVFGDGADIKRLLPLESSRFLNVTAEFFLLLKTIYKSPIVIDVLNVPDIQRSMERTLDLLTKIRKSLSDYLEKQRELFPRFYFVGNEDLLEIIGNSHDAAIVSKHFKTLFSGVAGAISQEDKITAVTSPEGEILELHQPVSLDKNTTLHSWLTSLEHEVKVSLSIIVGFAINDFEALLSKDNILTADVTNFTETYQLQVTILAAQVCFTKLIENIIESSSLSYQSLQLKYVKLLEHLAMAVLDDIPVIKRRKYENLIIEFIHQRDILSRLIDRDVQSKNDFSWKSVQRFYYDSAETDEESRLKVEHGGATFMYGFEYLGVQTRLVYTPLIDNCFLSMTQALSQRVGGSPFGPAGTGKTESIKALGQNLGKMVLVFCCDESFDFQAMGRILLGICEVGAWACFDEFNRLDRKILSAVSSQVEKIELSLQQPSKKIQLLGKDTSVHPETGIFITMNPGYAGRSELPENLKKLFRSFSMDKPDREIIAEVILNSQGFTSAKSLSEKLVPFFLELERQSTDQTHYDFGLRSLKSMLINCGVNKRRAMSNAASKSENFLVLKSLNEAVAPKLVTEDELVFKSLQKQFFGVEDISDDSLQFIDSLESYCSERGLTMTPNFIKRATQLRQIQETHHGIILFGAAGIGKTVLWKATLSTLSKIESVESSFYIIDCKVMSKENIYGYLDPVTREWSDGLLTSILRRIRENLRGELSKKTWIVLDGDVDPEWIENLNSVLDDNKILTLPNGERIALPENVRLIFEVDSLKYATPATISRCGIIYIGAPISEPAQLLQKLLFDIESDTSMDEEPNSKLRISYIETVRTLLNEESLTEIFNNISSMEHIMKFDRAHALKKLQIMLTTFLRKLISSSNISDVSKFGLKATLVSCCWAFVGDASSSDRKLFSDLICDLFNHPRVEKSLVDYTIDTSTVELVDYLVPSVTLESHEVTKPDIIIPTSDTVKHENLIYAVINEHSPLIMCGPPGSGKTMTFLSALRKSPNLEFVDLNFSKETTPELLLKTIEQYCEYRKTANGTELIPRAPGKWLIVFADELNLPKTDKFNTQRVICFLRELIERTGFYKGNSWIKLSNIQFVGACNPASDPGRNELSMRFLRNLMVISVNYPVTESLYQIYGTMITAILKSHSLPQYSNDFTHAVVKIYETFRTKFSSDVISPRDISRVIKGVYVYLEGSVELNELIRLLVFNSLRVYTDKVPSESRRTVMFEIIKSIIMDIFPNRSQSLFKLPILYSNWLSLSYQETNEKELRSFISERLRVFCEEEVDVSLVLYDALLDHILRIDRVLKQPQGHLILIGPSSSGKTTLTKFVSWINGFKIVQLATNRGFTLEDFDSQLKDILKRSAISNEKISFIVDESNILETSFLERMNNLLSSCEVPGLFEEDEIRSMTTALGLEESEFSGYFKRKIAENLHVVLTMGETKNGTDTQFLSSPALINRCVVNWMGDWSDLTLHQVGQSLIRSVSVDMADFKKPESYESFIPTTVETYREILIDTAIFFHRTALNIDSAVDFTPGHFLNFIQHFRRIFNEKEESLQEYQRHINVGLEKLRDTVLTVKQLKEELSIKNLLLATKDKEANEMLSKMLTEQNEAERKREASIEIQVALEGQEKEIETRRAEVLGDLAIAEPAVIEALRGVKNIKKEHLNELKAMRTPPDSVVLTLESVCSLLGYDTRSWRDVQLVIRGDTFISDIVNFDNEKMCSSEVIEFMEKKYLSRPDYNYAAANRGSKACGPLLQWVEAQISYATILDKISPLREEVDALEAHTDQTKRKLIAVDGMIHDLEASIEHYKEDYSSLIRETENIKSEMKVVKSKVERSMTLMDDLTGERERWRASVKGFHKQRTFLVGDSLISAAFLSYCGYFDQKHRSNLLKVWRSRLRKLGIEFDENYSSINCLSNPDDIVRWRDNGLVNDDLFVENMIIIDKAENCPFIIDPSGKISEVLTYNLLPKKLIITSFLDDGFVKQLENALRFGSSILIQDGEHFDPIVSPILANNVQKVGSRTLVRLGKQIIDWAPGFKMFISTKDSSIKIPSFVFSRVTVTNFTITESSLISQSLDMTLRLEKPEIEIQRIELMKLSGEYKVHLRDLEDELLKSLNESAGNILESEEIMSTLQKLKSDLKSISIKMEETAHVMNTVDQVLDQFYPLASSCSVLFELLQSLKMLNPFYMFSLKYFTDILAHVLEKKVTTSMKRLDHLILSLYQELYSRTSLSLLNRDKIILALSMFCLYNEPRQDVSVRQIMSDIVEALSDKSRFSKGIENISKCIELSSLEECDLESNRHKFLHPLLLSLTKSQNEPALLMHSFANVASFLFMTDTPYTSSYEVEDVIASHLDPTSPIILASPDGYDASYRIPNDKLVSIAMGSNEGIEMANSEILRCAKEGGWVLLQNIQMSPQWLDHLEKRLSSLSPVKNFRLFLTCTLKSAIPMSLLGTSNILVFENTPGIKLIMEESFKSVVSKLESTKVEKRHLYFLLSWFHAVVQERLRFVPVGFTKLYDFNDTDFSTGIFIIDQLISETDGSKTNIDPKLIPWEALQVLIGEIVYGGKADVTQDRDLLRLLAKRIFVEDSFRVDFALADNLTSPEGRSIGSYTSWINSLPDTTPSSWIGLDSNVEQEISFKNSVEILQKVERLIV